MKGDSQCDITLFFYGCSHAGISFFHLINIRVKQKQTLFTAIYIIFAAKLQNDDFSPCLSDR